MDVVEAKEGYFLLKVRVQPRSSRSGLVVEPDGRVRVALTAPPVGGAANQALCDYLAKVFDIPRRSLAVVRGDKAREKTVRIDGLSAEAARARLAEQRKGG
jgi:uncharacterized protein (TIGR00251 family)